MPAPANNERADRILDAAGELLLRLGYRKVTIDDIARRSGVGKGTVYLHWRAKDRLFEALVSRESADLLEELAACLRADATEVRPHRFARATLLATLRRPLIKALCTQDLELLDKLLSGPRREQELIATDRYFELMNRYKLLRSDIPDLRYTMHAATAGFYLLDRVDPVAAALDAEAKATAIEHTIREAFEPAEPPTSSAVSEAAAELVAVYEQLIASYRDSIYSLDP